MTRHAHLTRLPILGVLLGAITALAGAFDDQGYRLPSPGHRFAFPRDHGSHPEFQIEWWYLTGHLHSNDTGDRFGFQATFFRYALAPNAGPGQTDGFGTNQLFMAHMALADPGQERFLHEERLNRDGWDAFAREGDLDVRNGNWHLRRIDKDTFELSGSVQGAVMFELQLAPRKPWVTFGENGLSRKGEDPTAASWYLTFPRLATDGTLVIDGMSNAVTGEAWMDHEISSSQLSEGQVGWDWASLRFDDGREIMVYILRTQNGSPDPYSTLAWIDREGRVTHAGPDQFRWEPRRSWTSPETGANYPIDVDLTTTDPATGTRVTYRLRPLMDAQEMVGHLGGISYWEGACEILDPDGNGVGEAYMELTGYAEDLGSALR